MTAPGRRGSSRPPPALEIVARDDTGLVARAGHVVVTAWKGPMGLLIALASKDAMRDAMTLHPGEAAYIAIIGPTVPAPPPDVRTVFVEMIREGGTSVGCSAIVSEADGFQGAIVRGVTAGVLLTVRPKFPMHVCTGLDDAERWLLGAVPPAKGAAYVREVMDVARRTRAALDA